MIARWASALRRTGRIAIESRRATGWALAAMTAAMFACALVAFAADRLDSVSDVPRGGASMVVYLGDVDEPHARAIEHELGTLAGVDHVEYVTPTESARRLERALGGDAALLDGIDRASLPASIEATLSPGVADVIAMSPTVGALRDLPGVDDVVVEDAGVNHFAGALATARNIAWALVALLGMISALIVVAALRVQLVRTRRERDVTRMLGAAPSFLIAPTVLAGGLLAVIASVLAVIGVGGVVAAFGDDVAHALGTMFGAAGAASHAIDLSGPGPLALACFIAVGGLLGMLAGALAGAARAR